MDLLAALQTRSGLSAIKTMWLDAMDKNPWANFTHIRAGLWENDSIILPIFALKYKWDGSGK